MSLEDFHLFLTHIEYSPENLEFYLWYVSSHHIHPSVLILL